jgi:DNA invertase Pin-like site-specific DNA recombinase
VGYYASRGTPTPENKNGTSTRIDMLAYELSVILKNNSQGLENEYARIIIEVKDDHMDQTRIIAKHDDAEHKTLATAYSYIRFSTPEQRKGDSLRRQRELSERYAKDHGLIIGNRLQLQDLGKSAYSGKHRSEGALGQFLKLAEMGKIAKGSVLLVESLDRLSREQITTALKQFLAIIDKGIKIVTLIDQREYSQKTINTGCSELIVSLTIMARAHEESATKALRLSKAWERKRKLANVTKLTASCPAWLKLNDTKTQFDVIEDRVEIIRKIFDMKLSGKGLRSIIRELNGTQGIWKPKSRGKRTTAEKLCSDNP